MKKFLLGFLGVVLLGVGLLGLGGCTSKKSSAPVTDQEIVEKIKNGDVDFVKQYFTDHKELVQSVVWKNNEEGQTLNYSPFIVAAIYGQPDIMTVLYDINPNCIHDLTAGGGTPFAEAAWYNQVTVLNWYKQNLITAPYDFNYYLNKADSHGNTPLDEAMQNNSIDAIQWLQANRAVRGSKK